MPPSVAMAASMEAGDPEQNSQFPDDDFQIPDCSSDASGERVPQVIEIGPCGVCGRTHEDTLV